MTIVQGWDADSQGWAAEMALNEALDGTFIVTLTQSWRMPDRGAAEIIAGVMRNEAEEHKKAIWGAWPPAMLAARNREGHYG